MDTEPFSLISYLVTPVLFFVESSTLSVALVLMILLAISALVSAAEVAFFSLSPTDNESLKKADDNTSKLILRLKETPRKLLATILIANNFINIAIVLLSDMLLRSLVPQSNFDRWAESIHSLFLFQGFSIDFLSRMLSFIIAVVGVTFLLVLFGEVLPKIYANINNIRHAKLMARPLSILIKVFSPLTHLLVKWSQKMEERTYHKRLLTGSATDRNEVAKAIELTVQAEENQEEVDILKGIVKFGDVTVKQIMKSRVDVVALDIKVSYKEVLNVVKQSGFSRIPVYEDDFDKIRGIIYSKDFLGHTREEESFDWRQFIREHPLFVPETKKIIDLLKEFQARHTHIAIVVDEFGGSAGLVTLEDIMEEIVGDIRDELDTGEEVSYVRVDERNYVFDGKTMLNDVARILGLNQNIFDEARGDADSLAGLILEIEGRLPKRDAVLDYKDLKFTIVSVNQRRIEKVNITV